MTRTNRRSMSPMPTELTLFRVEDHLLALLDSAELVAPEQEAEYRRELAEAIQASADKRESFGQYLLYLDALQKTGKAEIDRIKRRIETITNTERRLKRIAVDVIKNWGTDSKGKFRHLMGHTVTMFVRALPSSVEIIDDSQVPDEYKRVTVDMPLTLWQRLIRKNSDEQLAELPIKYTHTSKELIERALIDGRHVPGTDLRLAGSDHTLIIK